MVLFGTHMFFTVRFRFIQRFIGLGIKLSFMKDRNGEGDIDHTGLVLLPGKSAIKPYRILWILAVFLGSVMAFPLVWDMDDAMNALMVVPNLISLLLLNGVIVAETRKYLWQGRAAVESSKAVSPCDFSR